MGFIKFQTPATSPFVYLFAQVSACNKGGCSDFTLDVSTNTSQLTPLPKLLFFSSEALMCLDFDNHTSITHFSTPSPAIDFAANFFENQVFWIDNNKIMWSAPLNAAQKIKVRQHFQVTQAIPPSFSQK